MLILETDGREIRRTEALGARVGASGGQTLGSQASGTNSWYRRVGSR